MAITIENFLKKRASKNDESRGVQPRTQELLGVNPVDFPEGLVFKEMTTVMQALRAMGDEAFEAYYNEHK